ncbi:ABC transporter permease [Desulfosarcina alkanivorans]|uniref:ABC transporter permease n=1 Tax=Desulfosarcina alkanivorans TaxID=571177 RepID=A0A5K7YFT0_9BACT|nr:ABC transporter permease [Desulfosarcina alkanivorans]BBO67896.1 ABC transporter permease [Desulfosarcina alkanivorans]
MNHEHAAVLSTDTVKGNDRIRRALDALAWPLKNRYGLYVLSIVLFLLVWDLCALYDILGKFLPRPHTVIEQIWVLMFKKLASKTLFQHLWASLSRVLIGWAIAVAIAVPLGVFMGLNRYVNAIVKPVFDLLKPMPPISWISLSILWFGMGETSKIFIIAIGSFVPCILNAYNGIRLIDPALYDAARMLGANRRQQILEVGFFASVPAIFAGLQISLSIAWTCVLAAELVGARSGMGFIVILGMNLCKPPMIIAGMAVIALTAWGLSVLMTYLEKLICPWKREMPN